MFKGLNTTDVTLYGTNEQENSMFDKSVRLPFCLSLFFFKLYLMLKLAMIFFIYSIVNCSFHFFFFMMVNWTSA